MSSYLDLSDFLDWSPATSCPQTSKTAVSQETVKTIKKRIARADVGGLCLVDQSTERWKEDEVTLTCPSVHQDWGAPYLVEAAIAAIKRSNSLEPLHEGWIKLFRAILRRERSMPAEIEEACDNDRCRGYLNAFRVFRDAIGTATLEELDVTWSWFSCNTPMDVNEAFRWTVRTQRVLQIYCESCERGVLGRSPPQEMYAEELK
jgi:hypothetical protein